ncbi:hypothetical protein BATDEDRAFT_84916 [Batrachochytrium dendrobatidis JAM81]|uniref:Borealin C-terminal domain-containing protein n=1 Tax=Batrachochytrium dendrobatidis (strain JAM81 / FGSC 10211) TaxID=684364 RepID=F4NRT1_BATDJ|nr:uncharacterized protein BATDEDRAFT_84916 [Batrachochytrium dendrobatidis JAM81]EGF84185.1 hypothetical protein BATDEDRAFT_84916 [Batrachochytrium dendrobatidis JAM81]|eukprot:XP_006676365.1 hypothetical protein BATDEDRAFT_84916 [Batrachochytrium dendrobatidis JAM81]
MLHIAEQPQCGFPQDPQLKPERQQPQTSSEIIAAAATQALSEFEEQTREALEELNKELNQHINQFPDVLRKTVTLREFLTKYDGKVERYISLTRLDNQVSTEKTEPKPFKPRISVVIEKHISLRESLDQAAFSVDQSEKDAAITNTKESAESESNSPIKKAARELRSKTVARKLPTRHKKAGNVDTNAIVPDLDKLVKSSAKAANNASKTKSALPNGTDFAGLNSLESTATSPDARSASRLQKSSTSNYQMDETESETERPRKKLGRPAKASISTASSHTKVPATPSISRMLPQTPSTRLRRVKAGEQLMSVNGSPVIDQYNASHSELNDTNWRNSISSARRITLRSSMSLTSNELAKSFEPTSSQHRTLWKKKAKVTTKSKAGSKKKVVNLEDDFDPANQNPLLVMKLDDGTVVDFDAAVSGTLLNQQLADSQRREVADQIRNVQSQLSNLLDSMGIE